MKRPDRLLGVFAKYWQPGSVKTRLAAAIGAERAAALYRTFLETTLQRLVGLADERQLCYWPAERKGEFEQLAPSGWNLVLQSDGDLGERMSGFFSRAFASGSRRVVLMGSDSPDLPRALVGQAFELLEQVPIVLGRSRDGGYYLVGARGQTPPIFHDVAWSTSAVWNQTIARLAALRLAAGTDYAVLPEWNDIDTADDLLLLRRALAASTTQDAALARLAAAIERSFTDASHCLE